MKIKLFALFIIMSATLTLTGCWDIYEISNHTVITLVGVDKVDDKVKLIGEYKPPHSETPDTKGESAKTTNILTGEGKTLTEARNSYLRRSTDDVFLGAVRAVVFSDSYAKSGIEEYLNRVRGNREYRKTIVLFTNTADLEKLFDAKALNTDNVGFDIEHLSSQLSKNNIDYERVIAQVIEYAQVGNTGYLINNLDIVEKKIEVTGYSIFKDNKKVGLIPVEKMKGNNYILIKNAYSEYTIDFEGVTVALAPKIDNRKITVYYDNENITFNIKLALKCEIMNTSGKIKIDKEKMKEIEEKVSDIVKEDIYEAIKTSQIEYGCDYLFFYKYFRAKYNSDFKNMNWNEEYKKANFNIEVKTKASPGNMTNFN